MEINIFSADELAQKSDDPPVVRLVNQILHHALKQGASDIHFEPFENNYRVRLRQDGILQELDVPLLNLAPRVTSRLKILSELDISERRLPQDGRFKMTFSDNRTVECRVSTCPTLFGEKIVIRVVDPAKDEMCINELGLEAAQKATFIKALTQPQGLILVTGPTGSGKTLSLYSALNLLNVPEINISTVENPVERYLPGINQINIHPKAGLTFSSILRSLLRQDPDIIMVGEIRDLETAEIALRAAQTGHLVLSTLHTNSAAETAGRLIHIGIPPFQVATSLTLIVAQRLARTLCPICKEAIVYAPQQLADAGFTENVFEDTVVYRAAGCTHCRGGFKGRIGIFEVLPITTMMGQLILAGANAFDIQQEMKKTKITFLRHSGLQKVKMGITSLEEVLRITRDIV